jgi:hypothetical protein
MGRHFLIGLALTLGTTALGSGSASACSWRGSSNCGMDDYVTQPAFSYYVPAPAYGYGQPPYGYVPLPAYGYGPPAGMYGYGQAPVYRYGQPPSYGYAPSLLYGYSRPMLNDLRSPAYGFRDVGGRRW